MIVYDTPRRTNYRHYRITSHLASTEFGKSGTIELMAFARRVGLREAWIQNLGTPTEHFDLFDAAILRAGRAGAVLVTPREFIRLVVTPKRDRLTAGGVHALEHIDPDDQG